MNLKNFSRLTVIIIATAIYSTSLIVAGFDDVPNNHPNADAINYVQENKIVSGYPDGTYQADKKIVRAEFIKIVTQAVFSKEIDAHDACYQLFIKGIVSCAGRGGCAQTVSSQYKECIKSSSLYSNAFENNEIDSILDKYHQCFSDVDHAIWYAKYICFARANKIIDGYPDGTVKPGQNISFVEAAKIIAAAFRMEVRSSDPWYKTYVDALSERKSIPISITSFNHEITRGEMAEHIYRVLAEVKNKQSQTYNQLAGITEASNNTNTNQSKSAIKEFQMTAKQFEFIPNTITVNKGDTVKLNITSIDVDHGFALSKFNIKENLSPGKTVTVQFQATENGEYTFFCSLFCGDGHGNMQGKLIVK